MEMNDNNNSPGVLGYLLFSEKYFLYRKRYRFADTTYFVTTEHNTSMYDSFYGDYGKSYYNMRYHSKYGKL